VFTGKSIREIESPIENLDIYMYLYIYLNYIYMDRYAHEKNGRRGEKRKKRGKTARGGKRKKKKTHCDARQSHA
jgi:hypothetical protein